ncbi:MAG: hypothetical protein AAFR65_10120 [Pseudomonadota bacterium]
MSKPLATLVFDIGKTHVKLVVMSVSGERLFSVRRSNTVILEGPYPHVDVEGIWAWFKDQAREVASRFTIDRLAISTHGACAALVDRRNTQLLLPVLDYEFDGLPREPYDTIRPPFHETLSPNLPAGLNLGRQLFWLMGPLSDEERANLVILPYPSYWAYRLTGLLACEVTSLGCHTDLWNPRDHTFSSMIRTLDIGAALPPIISPLEPLGKILPSLANELGLSSDCLVMPGLHDSNAGYLPYLPPTGETPPTVISTGTWTITMSAATDIGGLREHDDMLANTDALGNPIATARFMGGREFETICELTDCDIATSCELSDVQSVVDAGIQALPSFAAAGPYKDDTGSISAPPSNGKALANLYTALMIDDTLSRMQTTGDVIIEGSFAANILLCEILAALRPKQRILRSLNSGGVVKGCALASRWPGGHNQDDGLVLTVPAKIDALDRYAEEWQSQLTRK